jgi:hypothetical protein
MTSPLAVAAREALEFLEHSGNQRAVLSGKFSTPSERFDWFNRVKAALRAALEERGGGPPKWDSDENPWKRTAAEFGTGLDFYRGLVDRCARALDDVAIYVSDDGSVQDSPVRLKVPDMIAALVAKARSAPASLPGAEGTQRNEHEQLLLSDECPREMTPEVTAAIEWVIERGTKSLAVYDAALLHLWDALPVNRAEAHQVGVLSSESEESRRVHETGFCWCGAHHEEPPKQSVWWLIERPTGGQPIWWTGDDSAYPWSTDANNARRFATKEAAQEQITTLSGIDGVHEPFGVATSHMWLDRADHLAHPLSSGAPRQPSEDAAC